MRIFANCKEAINEITRDLAELAVENRTKSYQDKDIEGKEEYFTKELQAYSFCIVDTADMKEIAHPWEWCLSEFGERIGLAKNPGNAWKLRKDVWEQFIEKGGEFSYTYSQRIDPQVQNVIDILKNDPGSRQAIIQIYDKHRDMYNYGGKHRVPCSLMYHLMIRENRVDLIYYSRSMDWLTHGKNDIVLASMMKNYIAGELELVGGRTFVNVSSLHAYKKDLKGVF
jgi:thymidylate synthase